MVAARAGVSYIRRPASNLLPALLLLLLSLTSHLAQPHQKSSVGLRSWQDEQSISLHDERRRRRPSRRRGDDTNSTSVSVEMATTHKDVYSAWSPWSPCNTRCVQKRERYCLHASTCGDARHKEERSCRGGRCREASAQGLRFRVLRTSKRRGGRGQKPGSLFGKWSRWSPCTKSCTTRRFRWCKKAAVCGNDVEREEAFCYVKGSFCHKWIFKRIRQNDENNEADVESSFEDSDPPIPPPVVTPDYSPAQEQCGVPYNISNNALSLRIIGGRTAIRGRWPWQVAILNRFKEAFCGGTLISPQWVLTAAHCVRKRLFVRIGEHNLQETEGSEIELKVEQAVVHPSYDADTVDNDVALLRLPSPGVRLDRYRGLACLPKPKHQFPVHKMCTIIGWGKRRPADAMGTKILHEAEVPIMPHDVCREVYEDYYITSNMFCAGHPRGRMDSCAGDSGGPLLCNVGGRWTIYGITSFGEGCGKRGKFGIYTKVPNYVKWIHRVTGM